MPIERQAVRIPQRVQVYRISWLPDEPCAWRTDAPRMSAL